MTAMTTATAAERLGVSQRQVQRLIASGELPAARTAGDAWVVNAAALNALARTRPAPGRPWSPAVAWAALWQLSGLDHDWLDRRSASRLSQRLVELRVDGLLHACRRRAIVHRYRVSESFLPMLADSLIRTGASAMRADTFGMGPDRSRFDGYCADDALDDLVRRFHLVDDPRGNATIRVTNLLKGELGGRREMPLAVVAADLAESIEARERAAGRLVLEGALETPSCPTNEG
jgi:excisionase family DNA binding protein